MNETLVLQSVHFAKLNVFFSLCKYAEMFGCAVYPGISLLASR